MQINSKYAVDFLQKLDKFCSDAIQLSTSRTLLTGGEKRSKTISRTIVCSNDPLR